MSDLEYLEITYVKALENQLLELKFSNGEFRVFDMKPYLDKGIFRELRDPQYFKRVRIDYGTVTWPHEQDMSPTTLYLEGLRSQNR